MTSHIETSSLKLRKLHIPKMLDVCSAGESLSHLAAETSKGPSKSGAPKNKTKKQPSQKSLTNSWNIPLIASLNRYDSKQDSEIQDSGDNLADPQLILAELNSNLMKTKLNSPSSDQEDLLSFETSINSTSSMDSTPPVKNLAKTTPKRQRLKSIFKSSSIANISDLAISKDNNNSFTLKKIKLLNHSDINRMKSANTEVEKPPDQQNYTHAQPRNKRPGKEKENLSKIQLNSGDKQLSLIGPSKESKKKDPALFFVKKKKEKGKKDTESLSRFLSVNDILLDDNKSGAVDEVSQDSIHATNAPVVISVDTESSSESAEKTTATDSTGSDREVRLTEKSQTGPVPYFFLHVHKKKEIILKTKKGDKVENERAKGRKNTKNKFTGDIAELRVITDEDRIRFSEMNKNNLVGCDSPWPGEVFGPYEHVFNIKTQQRNSFTPGFTISAPIPQAMKKNQEFSILNNISPNYFGTHKKTNSFCSCCFAKKEYSSASASSSNESFLEQYASISDILFTSDEIQSIEYWKTYFDNIAENQKFCGRIAFKIVQKLSKGYVNTQRAQTKLISKKYEPARSSDIVGNKDVVTGIASWLKGNLLKSKMISAIEKKTMNSSSITNLGARVDKLSKKDVSCQKIQETQPKQARASFFSKKDITIGSSKSDGTSTSAISVDNISSSDFGENRENMITDSDDSFKYDSDFISSQGSVFQPPISTALSPGINSSKIQKKHKFLTEGSEEDKSLNTELLSLFESNGFSQEEIEYFLNYRGDSFDKLTGRKHIFGDSKYDKDLSKSTPKLSKRNNLKNFMAKPFSNECGVILLIGPSGCGKTSAVYSLANEYNYMVHEIHAGELRSGKSMLGKLDELVRSHVISNGNKFFSKRGRLPNGNAIGDDDTMQPEPSQVLVLLQHVDVLFEQDSGMLAALDTIAQKSKRPIVATCSDALSSNIHELNIINYFEFNSPSPEDLTTYLNLILFYECGIMIKPHLLRQLCIYLGCNISKVMVWAENFIIKLRDFEKSKTKDQDICSNLTGKSNPLLGSPGCYIDLEPINYIRQAFSSYHKDLLDNENLESKALKANNDTFFKKSATQSFLQNWVANHCLGCDPFSAWINYVNFGNKDPYNYEILSYFPQEFTEKRAALENVVDNQGVADWSIPPLKELEAYSKGLDRLVASDFLISSIPEREEAFFEPVLSLENWMSFPDALQNVNYVSLDFRLDKVNSSSNTDSLQIPLESYLLFQLEHQKNLTRSNETVLDEISDQLAHVETIVSYEIQKHKVSFRKGLIGWCESTDKASLSKAYGKNGTNFSSVTEDLDSWEIDQFKKNPFSATLNVLTNYNNAYLVTSFNSKMEYLYFMKIIAHFDIETAKTAKKLIEDRIGSDHGQNFQFYTDIVSDDKLFYENSLIQRQLRSGRRTTRSKKNTYKHYLNWIDLNLLMYMDESNFFNYA